MRRSNRSRGVGAKPADIERISQLPELRDRALRDRLNNGSHVFASPETYKLIMNVLYIEYETSAQSDTAVSAEFYNVYRHLVEGGTVAEIPVRVLDKVRLVRLINKILRGEPVSLDQDSDQEKDRNDDREHRDRSSNGKEEQQEDDGDKRQAVRKFSGRPV